MEPGRKKLYVPQGGYWSSAMTTRTLSTNSITLEKKIMTNFFADL